MISEEKAIEIFGEELVREYYKMHRVEGPWGNYVSLPLIHRKFGRDLSKLFERKVVILSHPGYSVYDEEVMKYTREKEGEYGNYKTEYFEPLMKRITEAHERREKLIVYVPKDRLKETLEIIGFEDVILVPTLPTSASIETDILGVSEIELYGFMKTAGVEEAEANGEWRGGCYTGIIHDIQNAGIQVSPNINFPVRGSYEGLGILLYISDDDYREYQDFVKQYNEWKEQTYIEYFSKLRVENGSCAAIILREIINSTSNSTSNYFIHPWIIYNLCKEWGKEEIEKTLKELDKCGILRVGLATDLLEKEPLELYSRFNEIVQKSLRYETDRVIIPLIECELLKE